MADTLKTIAALLVVFVVVPLTILVIWDRIRRRRTSPPRSASDPPSREALLRPDWLFYEQHLQRPVPAGIREIYHDERLVLAQDIDYDGRERILTFVPLRPEEILDTQEWLGFDIVPLATTQFGDPVYLRPGKNEPNAVYVTHHDGGDTTTLAPSVDHLVTTLRRSVGTA